MVVRWSRMSDLMETSMQVAEARRYSRMMGLSR